MEEDFEKLKKEVISMKRNFEIESSNLKINYIASMIVVLTYTFFNQIGGLFIFGRLFSPSEMTYIITGLVVLFLWKECLIYAQYISRKILFRIK